MHKNYESIEEASQDVNIMPTKEVPTIQEEQKPSPETDEHEETPEVAIENAANRLDQARKFSVSEVPSEVNQSSIHLITNSNAMHMARRSELREIYFGNSGSDNNISRSGSAITVIDWNSNAVGDSLGPFTGGHNAVAQITTKKTNAQFVRLFST